MGIESGMTMENFEIVLMAYWKMLTYFWPLFLCAIVVFAISEKQLNGGKANEQ